MGFGERIKGYVVSGYNAVRNGAKKVVERGSSTVTAIVAVVGGALVGGSVYAEEVATGTTLSLGDSPINWGASATGLLEYLGSNLAPILGLTLGVVAVFVVFRWMIKGASGRA